MTAQINTQKNTICLLIVFLVFPWLSFAQSEVDDYVNRLYDSAEKEKAWDRLEWKNLIHYEGDTSLSSGVVSQVDDIKFFIASDGKTNPNPN